MLKIKTILVSLLAIGALASCSTNELEGEDTKTGADIDAAYMSLRITLPTENARTRAAAGTSDEKDPVGTEGDVNSLYVITFDENEKLVHHSRMTPIVKLVSDDLTAGTKERGTKNAILVSAKTKYLLVVVNPGSLLFARLNALTAGALYSDINQAISKTITTESRKTLVGEIVDAAVGGKGFTMINAGFYDTTGDDWKQGCLLDVTGNVITVDGTNIKDEAEAKEEAEKAGNRAKLQVERLSAKVEVNVKSPGLVVLPEDAQFSFIGWTLDYYNSTFYPFAEKAKTKATHNSTFYKNSFYTIDPNYSAPNHMVGLYKNLLVNRAPQVSWNNESTFEYCIENTMEKGDQKFGAATRVVIKAKYAPKGFDINADWFSFGGINYKDLLELQAAYTAADAAIAAKAVDIKTAEPSKSDDDALADAKAALPAEALLIEVCDNFLGAVNAALNITIATFADIEQDTHLDQISDGGEIVKIPRCIKWYQKSLNYYYYEIRHDNTDDEYMYFGKYGVVRNNWYSLTLNKVNGSGTPWYPNEGPDEPDPEDPIDEMPGFLAFDIQIAPWVYWETGFEI